MPRHVARVSQVVSSAAFLEMARTNPELVQQFTVGLLTGHVARGGALQATPSPSTHKSKARKRARR